MTTIFISYKRENEEFSRELRETIIGWGFNCWLDVIDIKPGQDWDSSIHDGLRLSDAVIGVMTPESLASRNVLDEWGFALSNNKKLFLLKLSDVRREDIPPRYIRIQWIDLTKDKAKGINRLQQVLSSNIPRHTSLAQITLTEQQNRLLLNFLSEAGIKALGKKFDLVVKGEEKIFTFESVVITCKISDSDLMALARLGLIEIYTSTYNVIFTDKVTQRVK